MTVIEALAGKIDIASTLYMVSAIARARGQEVEAGWIDECANQVALVHDFVNGNGVDLLKRNDYT